MKTTIERVNMSEMRTSIMINNIIKTSMTTKEIELDLMFLLKIVKLVQ